MIPKIIHYCWFGGKEKPRKALKCISSWRKFCPDYQIIEWNESNFNVHMNAYTERCYQEKKWAYLSDYARLYIVEQNGGIYFDTDVELLKNMDSLLELHAFFGFENNDYVATGLGFGSEQGGIAIRAMLKEYDILMSDDHTNIGCPILNTQALEHFGLQKNGEKQEVAEAMIFPSEYFNPLENATGRLNRTENTISIHWYMKSALSRSTKIRSLVMRPVHRIFGTEIFARIRKD